LSFVTNHHAEPLTHGPDVRLYVRSRMGGALGLCFRSAELSEDDAAMLASEIAIYKEVRDTWSVASAALLSPQATFADVPEWDVLQANAPAGDSTLVYVYQDDRAAEKVNVRPAGLRWDVMYDVRSVDVGYVGSARGADLMIDGIDVIASPNSAAHILV